jgi:hypothetical protein
MFMKMAQIVAHKIDGVDRQAKAQVLDWEAIKSRARMLPAMPIVVWYISSGATVRCERQGRDSLFRFYSTHPGQPDQIDAYALREAFLKVRTPDEALDFLTRTGYFMDIPEKESGRIALPIHKELTWSDFRKWQQLVRRILSDGHLSMHDAGLEGVPKGKVRVRDHWLSGPWHPLKVTGTIRLWLAGIPEVAMIMPESSFTHVDAGTRKRQTLTAHIWTESTLEAILATAYIDGLNGINYQLCALPDCQELYEVSSKHERKYCSQACAHKASVRKRRSEKKAAEQEKAKDKAPKSRSKRRK